MKKKNRGTGEHFHQSTGADADRELHETELSDDCPVNNILMYYLKNDSYFHNLIWQYISTLRCLLASSQTIMTLTSDV